MTDPSPSVSRPSAWVNMRTLSFATLLLCLSVIILGAITRLKDAGLGCPDWPLCYGAWLVPAAEDLADDVAFDSTKAWLEVIHRMVAGILGLAVLMLLLLEWRSARLSQTKPSWLIHILACLVIVQALFGMWTVTLKLLPQVVVLHLLGGMSVLGLLFLYWLRLPRTPSQLLSPTLVGFAYVFLCLVFVQIALGGWVSAHYAALACRDFPLCNGYWLPPADFSRGFRLLAEIGPNYEGGLLSESARTAIHWTHRLGALIVVLFWLGYYAYARHWAIIRPYIHWVSIALLAQILLGITNVLASLPLMIAVAHNLAAALLLLAVIALIHKIHYPHDATSSSSGSS